jgi:hypothetical protein
MSELAYEPFEEDERERHITRAEVMHVLNDPASYSQWSTPLVTEQSAFELCPGIVDTELYEWTDDILEAFRVDKTRWSERIIDPDTGKRLNLAEAATIDGDLSEALSRGTFDYLRRTAVDGYSNGGATLTLELEPTVHVDLCGNGELWVDPLNTSSKLSFSAVFRKVS